MFLSTGLTAAIIGWYRLATVGPIHEPVQNNVGKEALSDTILIIRNDLRCLRPTNLFVNKDLSHFLVETRRKRFVHVNLLLVSHIKNMCEAGITLVHDTVLNWASLSDLVCSRRLNDGGDHLSSRLISFGSKLRQFLEFYAIVL